MRRMKNSARRRDAGWDAASQGPPWMRAERPLGRPNDYVNARRAAIVPSSPTLCRSSVLVLPLRLSVQPSEEPRDARPESARRSRSSGRRYRRQDGLRHARRRRGLRVDRLRDPRRARPDRGRTPGCPDPPRPPARRCPGGRVSRAHARSGGASRPTVREPAQDPSRHGTGPAAHGARCRRVSADRAPRAVW